MGRGVRDLVCHCLRNRIQDGARYRMTLLPYRQAPRYDIVRGGELNFRHALRREPP